MKAAYFGIDALRGCLEVLAERGYEIIAIFTIEDDPYDRSIEICRYAEAHHIPLHTAPVTTEDLLALEDAYITTDSSGTVVATSTQVSEPSYTTNVVQEDDTLWLIAKKLLGNGNRWPEIANLNGIKGTIIYAGQKLKIPD